MTGLEGYGDATMLELFREDAETQIAVLSDGLIALESSADSESLLEELMRAAHSMKGAARIAEIDPIVKLTHLAEDIFVAAQRAELVINRQAIDVLLATTDLIVAIVSEEGLQNADAAVESLLEQLNAIRSGDVVSDVPGDAATSSEHRRRRHDQLLCLQEKHRVGFGSDRRFSHGIGFCRAGPDDDRIPLD